MALFVRSQWLNYQDKTIYAKWEPDPRVRWGVIKSGWKLQTRNAELHSAVSPICNRQGRGIRKVIADFNMR